MGRKIEEIIIYTKRTADVTLSNNEIMLFMQMYKWVSSSTQGLKKKKNYQCYICINNNILLIEISKRTMLAVLSVNLICECLDCAYSCVFSSTFCLFFFCTWTVTSHGFTVHVLFTYCLYIVHALKILKIGPTNLF